MARKETTGDEGQVDAAQGHGSRAAWHPLELLELAHEAVLVRAADGGTIQFWNRGAQALYGWTAQEALGQVSHVLLATRFPVPLAEIEAELLITGRWEGELVQTTREGRHLSVDSRWVLQHDAAGRPSAYLELNADITPRKTAEARAGAQRELAVLVESSNDAIIGTRLGGTIANWNSGAERLYGYAATEAIGQPISIILPPDRPDELPSLLARLRRGERVRPYRTVRRRKDGRHVTVSLSISPIRDGAGQLTGAVAIARDLTEQEQAEQQLAESEARFRATFEQAAVGIAHVALDGRWLRVNERLCQLLGYSRQELGVCTFQDLTYPDDLDADLAQVERLLAGHISSYHMDKRYLRKDGSVLWATLTVSLLREPGGEPQYFIAVIQDITDAKRAEAEVRRQAQRQAVLAEASHAFATAGLNARGLLDDLASRVGQTIGDTCVVRLLVSDGLQLEPAAIFHRDPAAAALVQELLAQAPARLDEGLPAEVARTGQAVRIPEISLGDQRRRIKRDSWPFLERVGVYSLVLAPLRVGGRILGTVEVSRDQPGRPYTEEDALLLQDLADRAALALEAGRRFEQSLAAVRARDEVLGAVSHDLKSPLTGIVGSAQLVQRDLARRGLADEPLARQVERIVSATQRMGRMMEELVDAVRLDAGQPLVLRRSLTDLVMLVQAAVAEQEATSPQHQLRVSATESEVFGDWDAARLRRVLDNLLSNAIKYSPAGGEVQVEVGTQVEAGRRWAVLRVSDQGVGIPARDLPHIFERFRRGRNVGNIAGTGIGLAGARGIVQQHGGSIEVASQEGQGSTFTVRLPLREAPRAWATPDGLGR